MNKYIYAFAIIIGIISCANKEGKTSNTPVASETPSGAKIYKQNCELCHGPDGKLALNGAKDLTTSTLDLDARILQITKGKGLMMAYEKILTAEEIKSVSEYTLTLK